MLILSQHLLSRDTSGDLQRVTAVAHPPSVCQCGEKNGVKQELRGGLASIFTLSYVLSLIVLLQRSRFISSHRRDWVSEARLASSEISFPTMRCFLSLERFPSQACLGCMLSSGRQPFLTRSMKVRKIPSYIILVRLDMMWGNRLAPVITVGSTLCLSH